MKERKNNELKLKHLGINTYKEPIIYLRQDCDVCRAEGVAALARMKVELNGRSVIATINTVDNDLLLPGEASLSNYTWAFLNAKEGDSISITHPAPLESFGFVRAKIYGNILRRSEIESIISDITDGRYSGIHIATFLTACSDGHLNQNEIIDLTRAMIKAGEQLRWPSKIVVDKHCVGGLPGNKTTLIVVPIVSAFGLVMPKTSSRAITSPAGTADTMEVLAPVDLNIDKMKKVVESQGGCIIWGGSVALSPADDILIQVERAIDLDSEGQLVASVLSKKLAAGSTHLVIDIPIGPTAKIRNPEDALALKYTFNAVGQEFGLHITTIYSDGLQPVGRGIGPALEAREVLAVLRCEKGASQDLRNRALTLAGQILEFSPNVNEGDGRAIAQSILDSGQAWTKFQSICEAQGGMREIPKAPYSHEVVANDDGKVTCIHNRLIARVAKLAGAPMAKTAGVLLHVILGMNVTREQPLFTVYAESMGELEYALTFLKQTPNIINIE